MDPRCTKYRPTSQVSAVDKLSTQILNDAGQNRDTPLHTATRTKNMAAVPKLLEIPKWCDDIDVEGEYVETPLHVACVLDNLEEVKNLLKRGASADKRRKCFHELHAVHLAASEGAENVLRYFLTDHPSLYGVAVAVIVGLVDTEGSTALHWAVQGRRVNCAAMLLDAGSRVDRLQTSGSGCTPLHMACYQNLVDVIYKMYEGNRDDYLRALPLLDGEGLTVLHRAAMLNAVPVITFLLQHGCDPEIPDEHGRTAAQLAFATESWGALRCLVQHGANPFHCDPTGKNCMHESAVYGTLSGKLDQFCGEFESDLRSRIDIADNSGCTALHYAAMHGDCKAFSKLIELGANWQLKTDSLKNVLHFAAEQGSIAVINAVIRCDGAGSLTNEVDKNGSSALNTAAANGHADVVRVLLENGAMIFRESNGRTPLHNAAMQGHSDVVSTILAHFPRTMDYQDVDGNSPLHLAAVMNHPCAVSCLLEHGAAVLLNLKSQTAIDLSISEKHCVVTSAFVVTDRWREFLGATSHVYGSMAVGLIRHAPDIMKTVLDKGVVSSDSDSTLDNDFYVLYDFSILEPPVPDGIKEAGTYGGLLQAMAECKRQELITHPLTRALLERKWYTYGMYFHVAFTLKYLALLFLLTHMHLYMVRNELIPSLICWAYRNIRENVPESVNYTSWHRFLNSSGIADPYKTPPQPIVYRNVVLLCGLLLCLLVKDILELQSEGRRYFRDIFNFCELAMCGCCVTYLATYLVRAVNPQDNWRDGLQDITFQTGSLTIFLAWFNLLRYCQPYGGVGIYAVMFFTVLKTMLKVVLFFMILTLAFTLAFYALVPMLIYPDMPRFYAINKDEDSLSPKNLVTPHSEFQSSNWRVAAMTLGDLDVVGNFITPMQKHQLPFPSATFAILAVFLLTMPVLLINLLIGLAVGDISTTRKNADSLRLECHIKLHLLLENVMPANRLRNFRLRLQQYKFFPNRKISWLEMVSRFLVGASKSWVITGTQGELMDTAEESGDSKENTRIRLQLRSMHESMDEMKKAICALSVEVSSSKAPTYSQPRTLLVRGSPKRRGCGLVASSSRRGRKSVKKTFDHPQ